jgi:hypothetical protein
VVHSIQRKIGLAYKLSLEYRKPWICRLQIKRQNRSIPDSTSMFATSFAVIGGPLIDGLGGHSRNRDHSGDTGRGRTAQHLK